MIREESGGLVAKKGRLYKYQKRRIKSYDDYLKSALFAGGNKGWTLERCYKYADWLIKKEKSNVEKKTRFKNLPPVDSADAKRAVREVVPWTNPRRNG